MPSNYNSSKKWYGEGKNIIKMSNQNAKFDVKVKNKKYTIPA